MKGLLQQVKLFDFLQFLNVSGREGVLSLSRGGRRTQIYFGRKNVKLLSTGRRRHPLFGELLLRWGRIGKDALKEALSEQKRTKKPLGEILTERNQISREDVEVCLRTQIAEEICDAITDENVEFEFLSTRRPPNGGYDALSLDGSGIILEAARRVDEWHHIRKSIPSFAQVYKAERHGVSPPSVESELPDVVVNDILFLIDGFRTVAEIIVESGITKLEVCRLLAHLKENGCIRLLDTAERTDVVDSVLKKRGVEAAIRCAEVFLFENPLDAVMRERLGEMYLMQHYKEDAYNEFVNAAEYYLRINDSERAVSLMRRASDLYPERIGLRFQISETLLKAGKTREAISEGLTIAEEAIKRLKRSKERLKHLASSIGNLTTEPTLSHSL